MSCLLILLICPYFYEFPAIWALQKHQNQDPDYIMTVSSHKCQITNKQVMFAFADVKYSRHCASGLCHPFEPPEKRVDGHQNIKHSSPLNKHWTSLISTLNVRNLPSTPRSISKDSLRKIYKDTSILGDITLASPAYSVPIPLPLPSLSQAMILPSCTGSSTVSVSIDIGPSLHKQFIIILYLVIVATLLSMYPFYCPPLSWVLLLASHITCKLLVWCTFDGKVLRMELEMR